MTNKQSAIIDTQTELISRYKSFSNWMLKHTPEILQSERGHNFIAEVEELESELATLKQGEKEKEENEQKYIRMSRVFYFVVMHKTDCYRAFKLNTKHEGHKSPEGKKLIALARQEIGYSDKTWSGDIYSSIYNTYKSIAVDGVNEPQYITNARNRQKQNTVKNPCDICGHQNEAICNTCAVLSQWNNQIPDLDYGIYEEKQPSDMREFVISEIKKGIVHPNPLTPSEMRVLDLCCKYMETHEVK